MTTQQNQPTDPLEIDQGQDHLEKPLDQSTKAWLEQTDKHINRMSTDENYRLLVAKSLS